MNYYGFEVPKGFDLIEERKRNEGVEKAWNHYFESNPLNEEWKEPMEDKTLRKLVRKLGCCPKLRGKIWMKISGGYHKMMNNEGYYSSILSTHSDFPPKSMVDIEKDLTRAFPDHPYFARHQPGCEKMRRILLAYSWRNPLVAYCQSFNYIVGILLLHYEDEEQAFWMFCQLIEEILPAHYYNPDLKGVRIDGKVFNELMAVYMPKLKQHLDKKCNYDVGTLFITGWFLSLFLNQFPLLTVIRAWDSVFLEGGKILFRVALSFFKIHEKQIMRMEKGEIIEMIKTYPSKTYDYVTLMKGAFSFKLMKRSHIYFLREKFVKVVNEETFQRRRLREKRAQWRVEEFTNNFEKRVLFKKNRNSKVASVRKSKFMEKDSVLNKEMNRKVKRVSEIDNNNKKKTEENETPEDPLLNLKPVSFNSSEVLPGSIDAERLDLWSENLEMESSLLNNFCKNQLSGMKGIFGKLKS